MSRTIADLDGLGIPTPILERLHRALSRRNGTVIITGTRESGHHLTFHACLKHLGARKARVTSLTTRPGLELEGVDEYTVKSPNDAAYTEALRHVLGRAPDVLGIAEMGGAQLAQTALEAGVVGHLVVGGLRSATAADAFQRLADMGIDPYLLKSSVEVVLAQRRVRLLCKNCREPYRPDDPERERLSLPDSWRRSLDLVFFRARGCTRCGQTGYTGALAIYELIACDSTVGELLQKGARPSELEQAARKQGFRTLHEEALVRCAQGLTSVAEVLLETSEPEED